MKISDICIRRPVFATVLSLTVMLIGLVSYSRLSVREYPKIDEPVVTVDPPTAAPRPTSSSRRSPSRSRIRSRGSKVSTSSPRSRVRKTRQISVRFKLERNPDSAAADVRDRVSRVRNKLPTAIDEPVIAKVGSRRQPDHLDRLLVGQALAAGGDRLRQPHRQAASADTARGG